MLEQKRTMSHRQESPGRGMKAEKKRKDGFVTRKNWGEGTVK